MPGIERMPTASPVEVGTQVTLTAMDHFRRSRLGRNVAAGAIALTGGLFGANVALSAPAVQPDAAIGANTTNPFEGEGANLMQVAPGEPGRVCSGLWNDNIKIVKDNRRNSRQRRWAYGSAAQICSGPLFARQYLEVCLERKVGDGYLSLQRSCHEVYGDISYISVPATIPCRRSSRVLPRRTFRIAAYAYVWDRDNPTLAIPFTYENLEELKAGASDFRYTTSLPTPVRC